MYLVHIVEPEFVISEDGPIVAQALAVVQRIVGRVHLSVFKIIPMQDRTKRVVLIEGKPPRYGMTKGTVKYDSTVVTWQWWSR